MDVMIGSDDFEKRPFNFWPEPYLYQLLNTVVGKPCVVLVGESHPINLEHHTALAVRFLNIQRIIRRKVKLVVCQDFWGSACVVAPDIRPDQVQCNDEYAEELALVTYQHLTEKDIVIRGNPGVKKVTVSHEVREQYEALRENYGTVYFYAGAGEPETSAELRLLQKCLEHTTGGWCLVAGFHPKLVEEHGQTWRAFLTGFGERVIEAKPGTGDEWGTIAPVIVSGASTIMTTAVYAGNIAISLHTPEIIKIFAKRQMSKVPQVAMGWAHSVSEPCDLAQFGRPAEEALKKLQPFDVQKAYEGVVSVLEM